MVFKTKRLSVRHLQDSDLPLYTDMLTDLRVMKFSGSRVMSESDCKNDLELVRGKYLTPGNGLWIWAVIQTENNQFVGTCSLSEKEDGMMELGYRLRSAYWRQGLGAEVFEGLLDHGFNVMNYHHACAEAAEQNTASIKIIRKHMHFESEYYNSEMEGMDCLFVMNKEEYNNSNLELLAV